MQYPSSVLSINRIKHAVILVGLEQTYPAPGARVIAQAQCYFPTLPIMLLSPRVGGLSRRFAHVDTTNIIKHINTDEIDWRPAALPADTWRAVVLTTVKKFTHIFTQGYCI
jgi:hypothetical protein